MRRVLLVSPHFPPDSTAGAHRVRLLAPHLSKYGWEPTVLTCDPSAYEGRLDLALPAMLPDSLRVVRSKALPFSLTRPFGIGDLGLRSFAGLRRTASALLKSERFDALFITIFPAYTALLGPHLSHRFGVPYVLDYQDPWVNAWGSTVGGGADGGPDFKSRLSHRLAAWLEPRAVRSASAITAVSAGTYEPILARNPGIHPITEAIPLGAEPRDFLPREGPVPALPFDPADGRAHLCYTGTILPLGLETLRAVLRATALLRDRRSDLYSRLRLHFIGTSNQTVQTDVERVMPLAREIGVDDVVTEIPTRLTYSTIVEVQKRATGLLAMGSSERHYTASKIFPLLLARRPLLAVYHEASSIKNILGTIAETPAATLIQYTDDERAETRVEEIYAALVRILEDPKLTPDTVDYEGLRGFFAETLAGKLAAVFDRVVRERAA
jgi:hypothetical protein